MDRLSAGELVERWYALDARHEALCEEVGELRSDDPGYDEGNAATAALLARSDETLEALAARPCATREDAAAMFRLALADLMRGHKDIESFFAYDVSNPAAIAALLRKVLAWLEERPSGGGS